MPKTLVTYTLPGMSAEERFNRLGPIAKRHGRITKGTVLPETQVVACPRTKVSEFPKDFIPVKYIEWLEQNQKIPSCCRHPENHEIEARKSHPDEPIPDTYIFHCTCGRSHIRFCVGDTDLTPRPFWE